MCRNRTNDGFLGNEQLRHRVYFLCTDHISDPGSEKSQFEFLGSKKSRFEFLGLERWCKDPVTIVMTYMYVIQDQCMDHKPYITIRMQIETDFWSVRLILDHEFDPYAQCVRISEITWSGIRNVIRTQKIHQLLMYTVLILRSIFTLRSVYCLSCVIYVFHQTWRS